MKKWLKELAKQKLGEDKPFEIGDLVRVKTSALYSRVRQIKR